MLLLVTYDITDDRLRRRIARLLGGYGERVQHSAFECRLRPRERRELTRRLQVLLKTAAAADARKVSASDDTEETASAVFSVRLYPLPHRQRCLELGRGFHPTDSDVIIA